MWVHSFFSERDLSESCMEALNCLVPVYSIEISKSLLIFTEVLLPFLQILCLCYVVIRSFIIKIIENEQILFSFKYCKEFLVIIVYYSVVELIYHYFREKFLDYLRTEEVSSQLSSVGNKEISSLYNLILWHVVIIDFYL